MSSLYGTMIKQEADYTTTCDEKIPECEKLALVNAKIILVFENE